MAATLANAGTCPSTGNVFVGFMAARVTLEIMLTSGMYDSSGRWAVAVGVPAKSSVSGLVLTVVPGKLGLAVLSTRLDNYGNSVRSSRVTHEMMKRNTFNLFSQCLEMVTDKHSVNNVLAEDIYNDAERMEVINELGGPSQINMLQLCSVLETRGISCQAEAVQRMLASYLTAGSGQDGQSFTLEQIMSVPWRRNILLRAMFDDLAVPSFDNFSSELGAMAHKCLERPGIRWSCAVCTVDAQRFELGSLSQQRVPLSYLLKPALYGMALDILGLHKLHE